MIRLLQEKYNAGEKISVVTCYDYTFARILNNTDIDCLLVGDSLGMVVQGNNSTLPVTIDDMVYHLRAVRRGAPDKPIVADMPFLAASSVESAILNAGKLMQNGCDAVKLEGSDEHTLNVIRRLVNTGIPVMGHTGLTPQSVHTLGGYRVQGRTAAEGEAIVQAAGELERHGAFSVLVEMVPEEIGRKITENAGVPVIGIGAGRYTSGQVLVIYDLLGMNSDFNPKYLKKYANLNETITSALNQYSKEVKKQEFPQEANTFGLNS